MSDSSSRTKFSVLTHRSNRRVWVVQEVAVARKSTLICGPGQIDMTVALEVASWLRLYHRDHFSARDLNVLKYPQQMWNLCWIYSQDQSQLCMYLSHARYLQSTNPRDKIYGMLGLTRYQSQVPELLLPDYTRPVARVFRDAARQCLNEPYQLLTLFQQISHRTESELNDDEMPSWVPHFDRAPDLSHDAAYLQVHYRGSGRRYHDLANMAVDSQEQDVLVLQGVVLCFVRDVSARYVRSDRKDGHQQSKTMGSEDQFPWIEQALMMLQDSGISTTVTARTLVADTDDAQRRSSEGFRQCFWTLLQDHRDHACAEGKAIDPRSGNTAYLRAMTRACSQRCFAIMNDEKVGLVPSIARSGDMVIAIRGGMTPLVLRPCGEDFRLVGEGYVDGWMSWQGNGEEVEGRLENESMRFRIR